MNKKELLKIATPIIKKIANHRKNSTFAYYEDKDIAQEIWVFCLEALQRFDANRAQNIPTEDQIEHFLNCHVSNRLKNLMRDKYFRPEKDPLQQRHSQVRINLINALPLDFCGADNDGTLLSGSCSSYDPISHLITEELKSHILAKLPDNLKESFQSLVNGNKVNKKIKGTLQDEIIVILGDMEYE
jgi:hypothetical protein